MLKPMRSVVTGILLCAAFGAVPARAEMLQFSTPDGIRSWPKLNDPPDWHQDQESSLRLNANSLIPDGVDPATAEPCRLSRGPEAVERDAVAAEDTPAEIGGQTTEGLPGEHREADREQRPVARVQQGCRAGDPDESVDDVAAGRRRGHHLEVLAEAREHLAVTRGDRRSERVRLDPARPGECVHAGRELLRGARPEELRGQLGEPLDRAHRA